MVRKTYRDIGACRGLVFRDISLNRRAYVESGMYLASHRMDLGNSPYSDAPKNFSILKRFTMAVTPIRTRNMEFITVTAPKS